MKSLVRGCGAALLFAACRTPDVPGSAPRAAAVAPAVPAPIPDERIPNLVAFTKLLGTLRYFHPSDEGASADWEALAVCGVPLVERARGVDELVDALNTIFHPVAPTARIYAAGHALPLPTELIPPRPDGRFVGWVHHGVRLDSPQPIFWSARVRNGEVAEAVRGDLALLLPLSAVRGKNLTAHASVRAELAPANASATLLLYTVSAAGYDILGSAPVTRAAWTDIELKADVPSNERMAVYIGLRLKGAGKAWIDDVSASVEGTRLRLENADFEAGTPGDVPTGWDGEGSESREYRSTTASLRPHGGRFCGALESVSLVPEQLPSPSQRLHLDLNAHVSADVPLTLFVDAEGRTLPTTGGRREPPPPMRERQFRYSANDRAVRIADVALAWSVLEHFYPYFDVVAVDWEAELRGALSRAMHDSDPVMFHATLKRLVAALHDGHGTVTRRVAGPNGGEAEFPRASLPVGLRVVEGRLVVSAVTTGAGNIRPGDVVLSIDDVPTATALAKAGELLSAATPQHLAYLEAQTLAFGPRNDDVEVSFQRAGSAPFTERLRYEHETVGRPRKQPEKIAELAPGVMYVDLDRISDDDFNAALPALARARGVVFDLRGYPGHVSPLPLRHLTDQPLQSAHWLIPKSLRPDRDGVVFQEGSRIVLAPRAPHLRGKIAFLADGQSVSYAETYLGIVEAYELGALLGEPTAGTNGNVNWFVLPGGYRVRFTGLRTLKNDGTRHHGVGIAPTVPCLPTIAGLSTGIDEVLACGVAAVRDR